MPTSADACPEHAWLLAGVTFVDGAFSEYECERCGAMLMVPPGADHPQTV